MYRPKVKAVGMRLHSTAPGEIIDLLDKNVTKNLVMTTKHSSPSRKRKRMDEDDLFLQEKNGRLVVLEDDDPAVAAKLEKLRKKEREQLKPRRLKRRRIQ